MISQVIHAQRPAVFVAGLLPDSYTVLAAASARVYHAQLSPKNAEWCYSRLRGTLVLGKDTAQVEDPLRGPHNHDNTTTEAEDHWFRLLDTESGKAVWMFRFYTGFSYQLDRPFFHVFQGRSRRFGFLFEDDDEATAFAEKVASEACSPRKHRSLSLSRGTNQGSRRAISPEMVSAPAPHSFVHVAHMGVNDDSAIEVSKGINPSWKAGLSGLQDGRTSSESKKDGHTHFADRFWTGVGNDIQIKPKTRRMIPASRFTA